MDLCDRAPTSAISPRPSQVYLPVVTLLPGYPVSWGDLCIVLNMSLVPYGQSQELTTVQRRRRSLGSDYGDRYDDRSSDRRDHLRPRRSTRHASPRGSGIGSRRHSRDSYDSSPKSWESRLNDLGKHFMGAKRYIESKHLTETQQISITEGVIEGDWLASGMATALRRSRTGYDPKCTYEEGRKETLCPFREAIDSIDTHLKETGYKMRPEDRRRRKDLLRALRDDHTGQWDSMASTRWVLHS